MAHDLYNRFFLPARYQSVLPVRYAGGKARNRILKWVPYPIFSLAFFAWKKKKGREKKFNEKDLLPGRLALDWPATRPARHGCDLSGLATWISCQVPGTVTAATNRHQCQQQARMQLEKNLTRVATRRQLWIHGPSHHQPTAHCVLYDRPTEVSVLPKYSCPSNP